MMLCFFVCFIFFFKQKTAYEMRISDWSSDVCSSDLVRIATPAKRKHRSRSTRRNGAAARIKPDPTKNRCPTHPDSCQRRGPLFHIVGRIASARPPLAVEEIGRASCRERVCTCVYISVVAGKLQKKRKK